MAPNRVSLRDVVDFGKDAALSGLPKSTNPYHEKDVVLRAAWLKGYDERKAQTAHVKGTLLR